MKKLLPILAAFIFIAGCGPSTYLSSSWKSPDPVNKFNKVMVISLVPDKYIEGGRVVEQKLVSYLQSNGVNAVSAYQTYGPVKFRGNDEQMAMTKLKEAGCDGLMIISLLDASKEMNYVPGSTSMAPYYGSAWGYYGRSYGYYSTPGYYEEVKKFSVESTLYDLRTGKLVYQGLTKSESPSSVDKASVEYSESLVEDMKKKGVI